MEPTASTATFFPFILLYFYSFFSLRRACARASHISPRTARSTASPDEDSPLSAQSVEKKNKPVNWNEHHYVKIKVNDQGFWSPLSTYEEFDLIILKKAIENKGFKSLFVFTCCCYNYWAWQFFLFVEQESVGSAGANRARWVTYQVFAWCTNTADVNCNRVGLWTRPPSSLSIHWSLATRCSNYYSLWHPKKSVNKRPANEPIACLWRSPNFRSRSAILRKRRHLAIDFDDLSRRVWFLDPISPSSILVNSCYNRTRSDHLRAMIRALFSFDEEN